MDLSKNLARAMCPFCPPGTTREWRMIEMGIGQLGLSSGKWVVANCGKFPSEKNCKLVIMAPIAQKEDLITAAATHAVETHGHVKSAELRKELAQILETVEL
jgi:hypothetical protein